MHSALQYQHNIHVFHNSHIPRLSLLVYIQLAGSQVACESLQREEPGNKASNVIMHSCTYMYMYILVYVYKLALYMYVHVYVYTGTCTCTMYTFCRTCLCTVFVHVHVHVYMYEPAL